MIKKFEWLNVGQIAPIEFKCGYCGHQVASIKGWQGRSFKRVEIEGNICICPNCSEPTYFDKISNQQIPGTLFGEDVFSLPENVEKTYHEARLSSAIGAYTASVLICRKLLMNIAVEKGAQEGLKFIQYIEYLSDKGYVPPDGKGWVDHIRNKGNDATHEIKIMDAEDAHDLISFIGMLLKLVYEFPNKIPKPKAV